MEWSGPSFREATPELVREKETAMRVWFDHADGLVLRGKAGGFELAGADHRFKPAEGHVEGETVLVTAPSVPQPMYVRYGWTSVVTENLYNAAGLPASTFTSERTPAH